MNKIKFKPGILIVSFSLLFAIQCVQLRAQSRFDSIEIKLSLLIDELPGLDQRLDISVSGVSIHEFLRGIAKTNALNLSIDPAMNVQIVNNFSNVRVADVLLFLAKTYDLDLVFTGSIISITKFKELEAPSVMYDEERSLLTLDLRDENIFNVVAEITRKTNENIVLSPGIKERRVSVYIQEKPLDEAIDKLALSNGLISNRTSDGFYFIEEAKTGIPLSLSTARMPEISPGINYRATDKNNIEIFALNVPVKDIITYVSKSLGINFFLYPDIKTNTTVNFSGITYEELLNHVLFGTPYSYKYENDIYVIGEIGLDGLREFRVLKLKHRTVKKITEVIPEELRKNMQVFEFNELNSLIITGNIRQVNELEKFVSLIDLTVPVVLIEVIIIDNLYNRQTSTGINAGLGEQPTVTKGSVLPGIDMDLGAGSINQLINSFNSFGMINLGKVSPNFYMTINALEELGILKVRSTPKLSTLNGREAKMSIGRTEYYVEEAQSLFGSQIPQNLVTKQYKPVNADLTIIINPMISGDENITLEISVEQSDFTARITPDAPPGQVSRKFNSIIRVKNEEVVLLGGLEELAKEDTASGIPFLARIPVIKWFFSSKTDRKTESRLNIFVKPVIIY